jgi:hypothetical protein
MFLIIDFSFMIFIKVVKVMQLYTPYLFLVYFLFALLENQILEKK